MARTPRLIKIDDSFRVAIDDVKEDLRQKGLEVSNANATRVIAKKYFDYKCGVEQDGEKARKKFKRIRF